MISRKIEKLEKDPHADQDELRQKIQGLSDQIPSQNNEDDMKECQHCHRRFLQHVAERHIPKCKDTKHRPKPPPSKADLEKKNQIRRMQHLNPRMGSPR